MSETGETTHRAATWLQGDQLERLRTACHDDAFLPSQRLRNEALVTLTYDAGLRVGELVALDLAALDFDDRTLRVAPAGEADRSRTLRLDPTRTIGTVRTVKAYLDHRSVDSTALFPSRERDRISSKAVRDMVGKAARVGAIRPHTPRGRTDPGDITPQTLRHSTAWRLLNEEDRTMATVQERLGHADRSTTLALYGHLRSPATAAERRGNREGLDVPQPSEVLDGIPDLVYVFDSNGQMRWWNRRVPAVTGYSNEEIADMHPLEFVPDDDTPRLAESIQRIVETGSVETRESELVTKEGERIPYEFNGAPLSTEQDGVWGVVGSGRDITARKRASRVAEHERERLALFVDAVTEYAMFLLDPEGRIVSWNPGAERIKGYETQEIIDEHFSILYPDEAVDAGLPDELLAEAERSGQVQDEGWRVRKDGSRFWAHVTITAMYEAGELRGFAKVTRDLTERRRREREIEAQRDELEELNRINTVIRDIDRALVEASDRTEIEATVCERLTDVSPYVSASIVDSGFRGAGVRVRATAGTVQADGGVELAAGTTDAVSRAVRSGEVRVVEGGVGDGSTGANGPDAAVAIPISNRQTNYGVLVVYADTSATLEARHRRVLGELGETIGSAIAGAERKAALLADNVVELTLTTQDPDQFFVAAAAPTDAEVSLDGIARRESGSYLEYYIVEGIDPEIALEIAADCPPIDDARIVRAGEKECLCEVVVDGPTISSTVAEFGGRLTEVTAQDGSAELRIELSQGTELAPVMDALGATVGEIELRAKRTLDRAIRSDPWFSTLVEDRLTDKQHEVLKAAYYAEFFAQPRGSTGEEVAESLGISPSTFHEHVRLGLEKVLEAVTEGPVTNSP